MITATNMTDSLKSLEILYLLHHKVTHCATCPYLDWDWITTAHLFRQDGGGEGGGHGGLSNVGKDLLWCNDLFRFVYEMQYIPFLSKWSK